MSPDMFFQVVVPLIGVKNTALLAITTPQSGHSYFKDLMNLKGADGEALFLCIRIGMVCASCTKHKRACNHKLTMNPHWKPPERTAKVDAIMSARPEMRDRETRGVDTSSQHFVCSEEEVDKLRARERQVFPVGQPDVLFTAIDPSGGGQGSDYAVVTIAIVNGNQVVVSWAWGRDT